MSDSLPSVSVVVPALGSAEVLPGALESIERQDYPNIVEVIVVAGDADSARVATSGGARVIDNPAKSTPRALNLGFDAAEGQVVVRCDAQSRLPANYVSTAVETLMSTGATNVGGMQVPVGTTFWERAIAAAMASPLGAGDARYRRGGEAGRVETVYLGVFDREKVLDLGGFDPDFVRNQDYELNHRIIEAGQTVWFDPRLEVEYKPRGSLGELWNQYFQYGKAKKLFARVHPSSLRWRQLAPPLLVISLILTLLGGIISPWLWLVPAAYSLSVLIGPFLVGGRGSPNLGTGPALAVMHLSWGLGFLVETGRR